MAPRNRVVADTRNPTRGPTATVGKIPSFGVERNASEALPQTDES